MHRMVQLVRTASIGAERTIRYVSTEAQWFGREVPFCACPLLVVVPAGGACYVANVADFSGVGGV
jgi:hypothetical protein